MSSIPLNVKEQILELAQKLPADKRDRFGSAVSNQLENLTSNNALKWALIGGAIGFVIDMLPFIDDATEIGLAFGGILGAMKDNNVKKENERIVNAIKEAYREALA